MTISKEDYSLQEYNVPHPQYQRLSSGERLMAKMLDLFVVQQSVHLFIIVSVR